jgi:hypothetical protein
MTISPQKDKRVRLDTSGLRHGEDALPWQADRQALLLEVVSDLIRTSDPGELGRMTFEHVKSSFGAVFCTNYRFDPTGQRLRSAFAYGIAPKSSKRPSRSNSVKNIAGPLRQAASALWPTSNASHLIQREASYANSVLRPTPCYPLKASDGRLLRTFAVASATRESFTDDEVACLGTVPISSPKPGSSSRSSRPCGRAKIVSSLPSTQPSSGGGRTIRSPARPWRMRA